jgi:putative selenate reductase FAD-binding subunit
MIEQFHRPATIREVFALKKRYQGRAVFLAGGTYLNSYACAQCPEHRVSLSGLGLDRTERKQGAVIFRPPCSSACALRPEHVISLAGLGLDRVVVKQGSVVVGPLCTLQRLIDERKIPAGLRAAAAQIVSRNVREMATIGGHLASNPPYSDLLPMLVALDAKLGLSRAGTAKTILVANYVAKPSAGLITKIILPRPKTVRVAACRNARASANARSIVSAALSLTVVRNAVKDAIIAVGGVAGHVVRLTAVEDALEGRPLPPMDELQALVSRGVRPVADLSGSASFRKYQAGVAVALALRDAFGQKRGRS